MARGKEVWAKVEPSFILGRSQSGQEFCSMSLEHQAVYLRLWCHCIEARVLRLRCTGAAPVQLACIIGVSPRLLRSFIKAAPEQLVRKGDFLELIGVEEHHKGLTFKRIPQTGNERGKDDPQTRPKWVVEQEQEKPPTLPPLKSPEPEPTDPGKLAGRVLVKPEEQKPTATQKATAQSPTWEAVLRQFPALERKAVARHAIRARADASGKAFEILLAAVVEVCEDEESGRTKITHSPLALASARLRDGCGLRNGTLSRVRKALGLRTVAAAASVKPAEPEPALPPPSREDLQAALDRAEAQGDQNRANAIRKILGLTISAKEIH